MWPHHVILNGYVCIFSNKIMPRPNGRHVDLVAFFLLLLFLSFSVLFLLSVSFFFFLVKYICGYTLKACQTFEIGFAIRKTRKVSTVLGALSCATKRWGGKRRAHTWIADAKWLKPKHTIIQRRQNWRHYFRFNHLCVCVCVQRHYLHILADVVVVIGRRCRFIPCFFPIHLSLIVVDLAGLTCWCTGYDSHCCNYLSGKFTENVYLLKFQ